MSAAVEKLGKDLCRCCHAEGSFHNLSEPRYVLGQTEVYSDMMKSCLDIELSPLNGAYCAKTYTICETCILRLRDATNFKHQVLLCEEHFRHMYKNIARANIELKVETQGAYEDDSLGLKQEEHGTCANEVKEEYSMMEDDDGRDDKFDDSDDERPVIKIKVEGPRKKKMQNRNRASKESKVVGKRERKTYSRTVKDINEVPAVGEKTGEQTSEAKEDCTMMEDDDDGADIEFDDSDDDRPVIKINVEGGKKKRMQNRTKEGKVKSGKRKPRTMKDEDVGDDVDGNEAQEQKRAQFQVVYYGRRNNKKYMCVVCDTLFVTTYNVRNHIRKMHKVQKCPICTAEFESYKLKVQHLRKEHELEETQFTNCFRPLQYLQCEQCPHREFTNKMSLYGHVRYHHKQVKCPDCSQDVQVPKLYLHRHEEHGAPIPTCNVCGLKNKSEVIILKHQRKSHMNEKNEKCNVCSMEFFDKIYLKRHMVKHTENRNYACAFCCKTFLRKSTLVLHEKIHTDEKNKVCKECEQKFVQKASLNYHMKKHHPNVPY